MTVEDIIVLRRFTVVLIEQVPSYHDTIFIKKSFVSHGRVNETEFFISF